jgi:hypothetical protein
MSIKSNTFGSVTLTKRDAKKFTNQVRYGKPKTAAATSVKRGLELSRAFRKSGKVEITLRNEKKR